MKQMMGMVTANLSLAEMLREEHSARDTHIDGVKSVSENVQGVSHSTSGHRRQLEASLPGSSEAHRAGCPDHADGKGQWLDGKRQLRVRAASDQEMVWQNGWAVIKKVGANTCAFWTANGHNVECVATNCQCDHDPELKNSVPVEQVINDCPYRKVGDATRRRISKPSEGGETVRVMPQAKKEKDLNVTALGCLCGACKVPKSQLMTTSSIEEGKKCPLRKMHARIRARSDGAAVLRVLGDGTITPSDVMQAQKDGIVGARTTTLLELIVSGNDAGIANGLVAKTARPNAIIRNDPPNAIIRTSEMTGTCDSDRRSRSANTTASGAGLVTFNSHAKCHATGSRRSTARLVTVRGVDVERVVRHC